VDFITQANCMTLNVEAGSIDLSRPQLLLVRFVSWGSILIGPVPYLDRRPNRMPGTRRHFSSQLTKLDLASYKECVAVKEFALNCRPAKRIALRMGG
jgi:hypothetical protein